MSFSPSLFNWGPLLSMILILTAMSFTHGNMYEKGTTDSWGAKLAKKVVAQMCFLSEALLETTSLPPEAGVRMDMKVLQVGQELMKETLPLQSGSRLYELQGLNSNKWYEVKISYPASIPANFTLQLSKGSSGLNVGRKLLNTEKIIFQAESLQLLGDEGRTFVLVSVEPEGIVAIPGVKERKHIIYNIVCDELLFGIPHQAWYVVVLVVLCLALALVIPSFLLPRNEGLNAATHGISKDS